jgi:hypothetical protein
VLSRAKKSAKTTALEEKLGALVNSQGAVATTETIAKLVQLMQANKDMDFDTQALVLSALLSTRDMLKLKK